MNQSVPAQWDAVSRVRPSRLPVHLTSVAVVLLWCFCPARSEAASFLFLNSEPGDYPGGGRQQLLTAMDGQLTVHRGDDNAVNINFQSQSAFWWIAFAAPAGAVVTPGTYENAQRYPFQSPDEPGLTAGGGGCDIVTGRFVVHEAVYGDAGDVVRFSADFEQHCESNQPALFGQVRIGIGDSECAGRSDGTPCQDGDACTATAACRSGQCVGADRRVCATPSNVCLDPGLCDPSTGMCLPPVATLLELRNCDDGNPCTGGDQCRSGTCEAGPAVDCRDTDSCTDDVCDAAVGCVHTAIPGTCGRPGYPSTVLALNSDPGDVVGPIVGNGRRQLTLTSATADFSVLSNGTDYVSFDVFTPQTGSITLRFTGPGGSLAPGRYDAERWPFQGPGEAGIEIGGFCNTVTGQLVVHEAEFGPGGAVLSFAADFEQHCDDAAAALRGSIRLRAGDVVCHSAPDGTPCDNADLCAAPATCAGGACVGTTPAACPAPDACHEDSVCDPASGACFPAPSKPDGTICDDGNPCTVTDRCTGGVCAGSAPLDCDDGNSCTTDSCDPAGGCVHTPVEDCATLTGVQTTRATSTLRRGDLVADCVGRCGSRVRTFIVLRPDGTYRIPSTQPSTCPAEQVTIPDEVGTTAPRRNGTLTLIPQNRPALFDAVARCGGFKIKWKSGSEWIRATNGRAVEQHSRVVTRERIGSDVFLVRRSARFVGPGESLSPPAGFDRLPECGNVLHLRCVKR